MADFDLPLVFDNSHRRALKKTVQQALTSPAAYEQLAEECSELTQAALKMARIERGENPTPVTHDLASWEMKTEFTDILICAYILEMTFDNETFDRKLQRWCNRLTEGIENE